MQDVGGHGDKLFRPPFKDSFPTCWGCCQWATLNHKPACNDPSRWRYKDLAIGCVRTTLMGLLHSRCPMGSVKVIQPVIQLDLSFCLSCFFPPDSTVLIPRAPLINIPALNSIWVCISDNQPATCIRKYSSTQEGLLFENYWLHMYL